MNKVYVAALVMGDNKVTYPDGSTAPLHQTLLFLGPRDNMSDYEFEEIRNFTEKTAYRLHDREATVSGHGILSKYETPVVLTESRELAKLRHELLENDVFRAVHMRNDQFPTWVSHISGLDKMPFGSVIGFNRLAVLQSEGEDYITYFAPRSVVLIDTPNV